MIGGKGSECCAHRVTSYVSRTELHWFTVCEQFGDGKEVSPIGLHRVHRGFTGLPMVQELLEPFGDLIDSRRYGGSVNSAFSNGVARIGLGWHTVSLAGKRWIINVIHILGCYAAPACVNRGRCITYITSQ